MRFGRLMNTPAVTQVVGRVQPWGVSLQPRGARMVRRTAITPMRVCSTASGSGSGEAHANKSNASFWKVVLSSGPRSKAELWGLLLGCSVFPLAVYLMNRYDERKLAAQPPPELPGELVIVRKHELGGPFRLRLSKTGEYVTDQQVFQDKWSLLYFGFSKCAEVCPSTLAFLQEVMSSCKKECSGDEELSKESDKLQTVFLSIDSLRDSPQQVEAFLSKYGPNMVGLCGKKAEVDEAAKVWRVFYSSYDESEEERVAREAKGLPEPVIDDTYQFDHSSAIYLVGPDGKMKDFFFKEMGLQDAISRLTIHMSDIYGFKDTREKAQ